MMKVGNLGSTKSLKKRLWERRVVCESAVTDEAAGAIAEDQRRKDYLIHYLRRGRKSSLTYA